MIQPIDRSNLSSSIPQEASPHERQKLFEIQFETSVLGTFIAVSEKNDVFNPQLSKIKNGLVSGQSPDQLHRGLNDLIDQINQSSPPEAAPFPPFQFSTEGSESVALSNFVVSLEKVLNVAGKNGVVDWSKEAQLFSKLSSLERNLRGMTTYQVFEQLNQLIVQANESLSAHLHIPSLPDELKR